METALSGSSITEKECPVDSFTEFAFQRGLSLLSSVTRSFLTTGDDAELNALLAINFIIDELQVFPKGAMKNR